MLGRKAQIWPEMEILVKFGIYGQKSKFWSNVKILGQKSKFRSKVKIFDQKSKFRSTV